MTCNLKFSLSLPDLEEIPIDILTFVSSLTEDKLAVFDVGVLHCFPMIGQNLSQILEKYNLVPG